MKIRFALLGAALSAGAVLLAQNQAVFTGSVVTGQLQLLRTTNLSLIPQTFTLQAAPFSFLPVAPEKPRLQPRFPPPPAIAKSAGTLATEHLASANLTSPNLTSANLTSANLTSAQMPVQSLSASSAGTFRYRPRILAGGSLYSAHRLLHDCVRASAF